MVRTLCVLFALAAVAPFPGATAGEADDLARLIRQRVVEIDAARRAGISGREGRTVERDRLQSQLDRLELDRAVLSEEVEGLAKEVEALEAELAQAGERRASALAALHAVADAAAPVASRTAERVRRGVMSDRPARLAAFERATFLLGSDEPQTRIEGLALFAEAGAVELRMASGREIRNEAIRMGALRKHAWVYRLGLLTEGFVTEDGLVAGLLDPAEGEWRRIDRDTADVQAVIDTLRERRPPAVLPVPLLARTTAARRD